MNALITRALFLDMDGVLNNDATFRRNTERHKTHPQAESCTCWAFQYQVEAACVERLNKILMLLDAVEPAARTNIVISSSWRRACNVEQMREILGQHGIGDPLRIVDETPDLPNDPVWTEKWRVERDRVFRDEHGRDRKFSDPFDKIERGMEIWEWLLARPTVTHFVILDDATDMWRLKPAHVHTHDIFGLRDEDIKTAVRRMQASPATLAELRKEAADAHRTTTTNSVVERDG